MDKFTKTTQIDISNMNSIEEDTPQKSKLGKIVAIVISLLVALTLWLYVTETDQTVQEKEYNDISVSIINENEKFNITADNVTIFLTGTKSQLVDVSTSEIIVEIDASKITEVGEYSVKANNAYVKDNVTVGVKNKESISVMVHVKDAK